MWDTQKLISTIVLAATMAFGIAAEAGQYNTTLNIGAEAPAWNDLPGVDGKKHSYDDIRDANVVVVAFTCNSCPYAVDVEDRLVALRKRFTDKQLAIVAINVNKVEEDRLPAMKERAEAKGFEFPYLWDESQKIAKAYGAKFTPEFFVINGERKVVYMGAFDDSPAGDKTTKSYVTDAVRAVLEGGEIDVAETPPIGCLIRYERERRRRSK